MPLVGRDDADRQRARLGAAQRVEGAQVLDDEGRLVLVEERVSLARLVVGDVEEEEGPEQLLVLVGPARGRRF